MIGIKNIKGASFVSEASALDIRVSTPVLTAIAIVPSVAVAQGIAIEEHHTIAWAARPPGLGGNTAVDPPDRDPEVLLAADSPLDTVDRTAAGLADQDWMMADNMAARFVDMAAAHSAGRAADTFHFDMAARSAANC